MDFPYLVRYRMRRRFALSFFYFQLLCAPAAFSYRSYTSFGALSDLSLGYRPSGVGFFSSPIPTVIVLAAEQPSLRFYSMNSNGKVFQTSTLRTQKTYRSVVTSDPKVPEFVTLSSDGNFVSVIRQTLLGVDEQDYPLQSPQQNMILADINGDHRQDVLLFGKSSAGIVTFIRQPNGKLKSGPTLFPTISISDVEPLDINGDGLMDLIALDWLSNQLSVFTQIGRLVFSEQITVPLPAEPSALSVFHAGVERSFRVAISFPADQNIRVYSGNSLGDYRLMNTIGCGPHCSGLEFSDVNGDDFADIVSSTDRGLEVSLGSSASTFSTPTVFGIATTIVGWSLADIDADGKKDCIVLERNPNRLITLANSDATGKVDWPSEYCVGVKPLGLVVADLDGNGRQDIAVVNSGSSSLSVLRNYGKGHFSGQRMLALPDHPTAIRMLTGLQGKEKVMVTSHSDADRIAVITLADDISQSPMFSIPTGAEPFTLVANRDSSSLHFVVRYRNSKDRSYALSSFDQISQQQFVERSLRSVLPTKILAMSINVGVAPGTFELLFATNDKNSRTTTVSQSFSESGMEFKTTRPLFSFPDSTAGTRLIVGGFLNNDPFRDAIVVVGPPRNDIGMWHARSPFASRDSIEWVHGVQPANDDAVFIRDVNDDSFADVVWLDATRHAVLVMYGTEKKGFRSPVVVAPAEKVQAMRLASLRDNSTDLILSNTERGTVSILWAPFTK